VGFGFKSQCAQVNKIKNYNVAKNEQHPFHMVDTSPWPLMTSVSLWSLVLSFISYFHFFQNGGFQLLINLGVLSFYLFR
jgi:hypothetical protein